MFINILKSLKNASHTTGVFYSIRNKSGAVENTIKKKLQVTLQTTHVDVINEIDQAEKSQFRLVVVTDKFHGLPMYKRYNLVNEILKEELQAGTQISSIVAKTPIQWHRSLAAKEHSPDS
ncbi:bolA-like protein DDB_G0274169 [Leguminivora glycinivorella]|uniref:bolA-like protein DDB_G0274169 n=1 Tax=Leguminivora glycinivorella TaxID=1035111 RepID=UPI00200E5D81|nr:bolA-like protein DDB_G0274169 [Leguminivora glycinivorella]